MPDVLPFRPRALTSQPEPDAALMLPHWARDEAERRMALIMRADKGLVPGVSTATLWRWRAAYRDGGLVALAPRYKGRVRKDYAWDTRALYYVQLPGRMNNGEIAANLRADGFADVTPAQVRRYRKTLPSNLDETSKKKVGEHFYRLNETPYVIRDWGGVPVGYLYEMDGHTCDFYIEHPTTGHHFRPELTFLIDVRSQYIVDFWLGGFENSQELRWLLSRAFLQQDHVCHELHVDPGAMVAKGMRDPVVGFCAKLGVDLHFALPGNARGKGLNEGEYKHFEGRFGKSMPTYLHNRTDDVMRLFSDKWKKKLVPRITVKQLYDLIFARYVTPRRNEPRKGLDNKSPADLWATLQKNPVLAPAAALVRPRDQRVVQNGRVTIHKRRYELPQPQRAQWEDRQVIVEYDDWNDAQAWIYDLQGRYQCQATLVHRRPGLPPSRVAERLAKVAEGQRRRLELKIAENDARSKLPITTAGVLDALDITQPKPVASDAERVLTRGITFEPAAPVALPKPHRVTPAALHELQAEVAADVAEIVAETETAGERMQRAQALQIRRAAGESLPETDARWLAIYVTSPEYHSRLALLEDFGGANLEEV